MKRKIAVALLVSLTAVLCAASAKVAEHRVHGSCTALAGTEISSLHIGLPTRGAKLISAEITENKSACFVKGSIAPIDPKAPAINFVIRLPFNWNGKAVQLGGAGYDGYLLNDRLLKTGFLDASFKDFATFESDSGHHSRSDIPPLDGSFAINAEALRNFAGAQLKKVHDVAIKTIVKFYGRSPRRMYFYGGSEGGREALIVAERYPADYDGVVSLFPAYDFTAIMLNHALNAQRLYSSKAAWLSPAKTTLIGNAVLKTCDRLDGLADGLVSNVAACRTVFHVETLRCPSGRDEGPSCLSDAQITTAEFISRKKSFGFDVDGLSGFSGMPIFEGAFTGQFADRFGTRPTPGPTNKVWVLADQTVRYMIMGDPAFDSLRFDPKQHIAAIQRVADMLDASSPNLDAFRRRGGKLILMNGTIDMEVPPGNSIAYYERLKARYGSNTRKFMRFYIAPGFAHLDGAFIVSWDALATLDRWVDGNEVPGTQVIEDATKGHKRSRPLCEYPTWPKYRGTGDPNSAESFTCVFPK